MAMAFVACGDARSRGHGSMGFTDSGDKPSASPDAPPKEDVTPEEKFQKHAVESAPLAVKGEVKHEMPVYEIPDILKERLKKTNPEWIVPRSRKFEVINQHLHIVTKDQSMTFTGVLRIPGKQDESFELKCNYRVVESRWECDDMFPVDPKVASEQRMQATAVCEDQNVCNHVSVEMFVTVAGQKESQLFQRQKFSVRPASSGDEEVIEEGDDGMETLPQPKGVGPIVPRPKDPRVLEKPTPAPAQTPSPAPPTAPEPPAAPAAPEPTRVASPQPVPELSGQALNEALNNSNQALDLVPPVTPPPPAKRKYSPPGIENLGPKTTGAAKIQAIRYHDDGSLQKAARLADSAGLVCRKGSDRNYGADRTIQLLTGAINAVDRKFSQRAPFVIGDVSPKYGGRICRDYIDPKTGKPKRSCAHLSHQNGLDADVAFPSRRGNPDFWSPCADYGCPKGIRISDNLDEERFFLFLKNLVGKPADDSRVIAFFVDNEIKRHMCQWARGKGEAVNDPQSPAYRALKKMVHWSGHHHHVHVRFSCPEKQSCKDSTVNVSLTNGCDQL